MTVGRMTGGRVATTVVSTARAVRAAAGAAVVAAVVAVVVLGTAGPAGAHTGDQSYVYLDMRSDRIEGRLELVVSDLNRVLGLDIAEDEATAGAQLDRARVAIEAYAAEHLELDLGAGPAPLSFTDLRLLEASPRSYAVLEFTTGALETVPRTFDVRVDALIEEIPGYSVLLIIGSDWGAGIYENEADHLLVYDAQRTSQTVALDDSSWWKGFRGTVGLGVEHIRIGTDHILFVLVLLLPSVLVMRREGPALPAARFSSSLWRVTKIATMFTLAHSITLTLGGLGLVSLPSRPVEVVIALSIAVAALHNLFPVLVNREWAIAFGFGLFHGFGFAGLLGDLGLGGEQRFWSLLGFNLGVEIGQLAIILLAFPTLYLLRRTRVYPPLLVAGSVGCAVVAIGWVGERVLEADLGVSTVMDRLVVYPRVLVVAAVVMVASAVLYRYDASRSRLRPVAAPVAPMSAGAAPLIDVRGGADI